MFAHGQVTQQQLQGLRILLVEDNFLIASYLRRLLLEWGCEVIGPAPTSDEGVRLVETSAIDGAILDINLIGGNSVPVAEALLERGRPFIFITGYGSPGFLPASLTEVKRLIKPIDERALELVMRDEFVLN